MPDTVERAEPLSSLVHSIIMTLRPSEGSEMSIPISTFVDFFVFCIDFVLHMIDTGWMPVSSSTFLPSSALPSPLALTVQHCFGTGMAP